MITNVEAPPIETPSAQDVDQRVNLRGVSWRQYEMLCSLRGEGSVPRIAYRDGEVELMTPSVHHEARKKRLARLVEAYAEEVGIDLEGYGSWTLRQREQQAGLEPDECYVLGAHPPERPDIAIEVVWTSGGIDKLELYRRLGVREVWIYRDEVLRFHVRVGDRWMVEPRSRLLPGLDPALVARLMDEPSQTAAVRELRRALRHGGGSV